MSLTVPVIAIDGPSGTGKGTLCQIIANKLNWHMLDSGSLYRVLALAARRHSIELDDELSLARLAQDLNVVFSNDGIFLDREPVTEEIRTEFCGNDASKIAALKQVREALLMRQRNFATEPGLVTDGRDMGTIVFPDAQLKIFLDASCEVRAERRYLQLKKKGINASLAQVVEELTKRDQRDRNRAQAPLKPADDAIIIDTTDMNIEETADYVLELINERFFLLVTFWGKSEMETLLYV